MHREVVTKRYAYAMLVCLLIPITSYSASEKNAGLRSRGHASHAKKDNEALRAQAVAQGAQVENTCTDKFKNFMMSCENRCRTMMNNHTVHFVCGMAVHTTCVFLCLDYVERFIPPCDRMELFTRMMRSLSKSKSN